jgi:hypothetical protein
MPKANWNDSPEPPLQLAVRRMVIAGHPGVQQGQSQWESRRVTRFEAKHLTVDFVLELRRRRHGTLPDRGLRPD